MHTLLRLIATGALLAVGLLLGLTLSATPALAADAAASSTPSVLGDTASWALLAGVLTPLLTSVVQQPQWGKRTRTMVGVAISVVVGLLTLLANGSLTDGPQTVLSIVALVVVTSATAYRSLWVPAGVAGAVEGATSPSSTSRAT